MSSTAAHRIWPLSPLHLRGQRLPPENILLLWLALFGLMVFAASVLWRFGVWHMLVAADPTFLTLVIVCVFVVTTLWCGHRSYRLAQQRFDLAQLVAMVRERPAELVQQLASMDVDRRSQWVFAYFKDLLAKGPDRWHDNQSQTELMSDRAHGPHETAWWVNGIQLKLGLLGKVIGFSILALQIGSMESFDPSQSQLFLKNLTSGLGIALLTTMTGLTANILLGLQLTRLDRSADDLVAEALTVAENELGGMFPQAQVR